MEVKKSPKADLESSKTIYTLLGLVIALGLTIALFSWNQSEKVIAEMSVKEKAVEQEMVEVTLQEDAPAPVEAAAAPIAISEMITIVNNNTKIDSKIDFLTEDNVNKPIETITYKPKPKEEVEDDNVIVLVADKMPSFMNQPNGASAFSKWVQSRIVYPQTSLDNASQGKVNVKFVVEKDGRVTNAVVMRGVDREIDAAALKVINSSPKWSPAENRGKPCRMYITMDVTFRIQ